MTMGCAVPTVVKATSASPRRATRSSRSRASTVPAAVSGRPATSDSTRSRVRLAMIRCSTPRPSRAWATPSPISPAPMTATRVPPRPPVRRSAASATAPCDSEVIPRAMAVSERTRLPVSTAWRNRVPSTGPEACSPWARSHARRTWPSTSDSPSTAESRPEATENRWSMTSSSNRMVQYSARASIGRAADVGQELLDLVDAVVEPLDHRVDLGAQARRQEDRLGQVRLVTQSAERLRGVRLGDRHPVQQVERRALLLQADDDHRHGTAASLVAWSSRWVTSHCLGVWASAATVRRPVRRTPVPRSTTLPIGGDRPGGVHARGASFAAPGGGPPVACPGRVSRGRPTTDPPTG